MFNVRNRTSSYLLPILLSLFLAGCGGAAGDTDPPTTNKPEGSSSQQILTSSASSKMIDSSAASTSTQTSSAAKTSSALATSSVYQRASRSSTNSSEDGAPTEFGEDITPPGNTKLFLQSTTETSATLIWGHAADDTGVYQYKIERNDKPIATLEFPTYTYTDTTLAPSTYDSYTIQAIDFNGNASEKSPVLTIRTQATTGSPITSASSQSSSLSSTPSSASSISSKDNSSKSSVKSSSSKNSSSSSSSTSSSSRASSSTSGSPKTVQLKWRHPTQRANGSYLELDDIGGYEIRKKTSISISYIKIPGSTTTNYTLTDIAADDKIDIAVYDTNGFYSDFIQIYPR